MGIGRPFRKGQRGNPRGRPKGSASLRALLLQRYGTDAAELVDRLHQLTLHRNPKVALQAVQLLLAYHAGRPTQTIEIGPRDHTPLFVLPPGSRMDMGSGALGAADASSGGAGKILALTAPGAEMVR